MASSARLGARNAPSRATASSDAGGDQRPLLADPGGERAGRQVTDQLAQPDQGDEERRQPDPGPEIAGRQRHQRQDRPLTDRDEQRRPVGGDGDVPQPGRGRRQRSAAPAGRHGRPNLPTGTHG